MGAADLATAIRDRLHRDGCEPIACGTAIVHNGVTIGVALFPDHCLTADELII